MSSFSYKKFENYFNYLFGKFISIAIILIALSLLSSKLLEDVFFEDINYI
jgi:hypothetical protein